MRPHRNDGAEAPSLAPPDTARSDEARGANAGQVERQVTGDKRDSATKAFATARAVAALAGFGLHQLEDGSFLLTRWGWCRELPSLREVGDMLRRIGGAR